MVVTAVLPALLLIGQNVRAERWLAQERIEQRAMRTVRMASFTETGAVHQTRDLLAVLSRVGGAADGDPAIACATFLAAVHEQYQQYGSFGIADTSGDVTCTTPAAMDPLAQGGEPVNVAGEDWFTVAVHQKRFAISDYEISASTGQPRQILAQPVLAADAQVRFVIFAVRNLRWMERLIQRERLPENSSLTLWNLDGTILVRYPNPEQWKGRKIEKAPILSRIREIDGEGLAEVPGVDGVRRLYAFNPILKGMLGEQAYLTVGIPSAVAFASVKQELLQNVLIAILVIAAALLVAIFGVERLVVKGLRELVGAIREITRGELHARVSKTTSGAAELRALGAAFDEMATALEGRQAEIDRIHAELLSERARLRDLSQSLVAVQEAERRRIARELHDEIGQVLTGLGLLLGTARRVVPAGPAAKPLENADALVKDLLKRVRELSLELRPAMLDDLGLISALIWFFERYTERTQIRVGFTHDGFTTRLPAEVEVAAYRIVQEALTNVARHAGVEEVDVTARVEGGKLVVVVEDRGKGFDPQRRDPSDHTSGLTGMHERAAHLGGTLNIRSSEGAGTTISAELPVPQGPRTPTPPPPTPAPPAPEATRESAGEARRS